MLDFICYSKKVTHCNIMQNDGLIAKNTLFLYIRMFFSMAIGLYTSRIVINALGFSDYGLYNLVGGIVVMLSFFNVGMLAASQRFMSYELGLGDVSSLKRVFCTSIVIHNVIALVIFLFAESLGLWFVNTYLNIPDSRMYAANWVYQCSILTFIISIVSVPYNSCIIAHEHFRVYAYVTLIEVLIKLFIAYVLLIVDADKLILYSSLILCLQICLRFVYIMYCRHKFEECLYRFVFDKKVFHRMFSYAVWSAVANIGFTFRDQGLNVILNLFFGTTMNAARGIAMQVGTLVNSFSKNFILAVNPQITKQYAAGNYMESRNLVYLGARIAFYLLSLMTIPLLINVDYVLKLWLSDVPEYTSLFLCLVLLSALLYAMSQSVTIAIQATGTIKWFQILICTLLLSELPVAYFILKLGAPPYYVMLPTLISNFFAVFLRFYLLKRMMCEFSCRYYFVNIVFRCLLVYILCFLLSYYVSTLFYNDFIGFICKSILSILITSFVILIGGISKSERASLINKLKNKLKSKSYV